MRLMLMAGAIFPAICLGGTVDVEMALLKDKAELCTESVAREGCGTTGHCNDFDSFSSYVFKGSASTYMSHHMQTNAINQGNFDLVESALKADLNAKKVSAGAERCN